MRLGLSLCLVALCAAPAWAQSIVRGPILQPSGMDETRARITLWTNVAASVAIVYGPAPVSAAAQQRTAPTAGTQDGSAQFRHVHTLTGLTPGQSTQYKVLVNGRTVRSHTFEALGGADERVYMVIGDPSPPNQPWPTFRELIAQSGAKGIVTLGDNGYFAPLEDWDAIDANFFEPWGDLLAEKWALVGLGNHDNSAAFKSVFPGTYNVCDGPICFAAVLTCGSCAGGTSYQSSVRAGLRQAAARNAWGVVAQHHPTFACNGGGEYSAALQTYMRPIFEDEGAALVLNGHEHGYARSASHRGVVYVTSGGGSDGGFGAPNGKCSAAGAPPWPPFVKPGQKMQQIGRLTANPRTLQWEALRRNPATGEVSVADSFTLVRDGAPPTAPAPSIALSKELTWTCANADTAMASGSWSGVRPTSGSEVVGNGVFTLQCSGDGGHSSTTVTIEQGVP